MSGNPAVALVKLGDAADVLAEAAGALPGQVRVAFADGRSRGLGLAAALATFILYLAGAGDLAIAADGRYASFAAIPSVETAPDWAGKLFTIRAAFAFEPAAAVYVLPQLAVFISPGDALLGVLLAFLVTANLAMSRSALSARRTCRRSAYGRFVGVLPAFMTGLACCAPTFLLLFGTGVAAAVIPVFVPLRGYLFPLAVGLMLASLLLSSRQMSLALRVRRR